MEVLIQKVNYCEYPVMDTATGFETESLNTLLEDLVREVKSLRDLFGEQDFNYYCEGASVVVDGECFGRLPYYNEIDEWAKNPGSICYQSLPMTDEELEAEMKRLSELFSSLHDIDNYEINWEDYDYDYSPATEEDIL